MNPALGKLGYDERDRVVIVHADDIGMCQATLPALTDLLDAGLVSSASTMVPCAWFPAVAAFCRENRDADMGVHLTLTCEYRSYRWGPISTRDPASGLLDKDGYFHSARTGCTPMPHRRLPPASWRLSWTRAQAAGIDITHIDTHQLSAFHSKLLKAYTDLAVEAGLPLMLLRLDAAGWQALGQALGLLSTGRRRAYWNRPRMSWRRGAWPWSTMPPRCPSTGPRTGWPRPARYLRRCPQG